MVPKDTYWVICSGDEANFKKHIDTTAEVDKHQDFVIKPIN